MANLTPKLFVLEASGGGRLFSLNPNGSGISLGHPIGATGARLIVTLLHALEAKNLKRGVAALCIGGGEATAVAVERISS